jgi:hypothetical protein
VILSNSEMEVVGDSCPAYACEGVQTEHSVATIPFGCYEQHRGLASNPVPRHVSLCDGLCSGMSIHYLDKDPKTPAQRKRKL